MTADEILNTKKPNREYQSYYHESDVLEAMERYANSKVEEYQAEIKELTKQHVAFVQKYKVMLDKVEEEKKAVWDRACEAQKLICAPLVSLWNVDGNSILNAPKPEYKP
jgi:predicted  nucleic acid-binding Zn-ribbon protein